MVLFGFDYLRQDIGRLFQQDQSRGADRKAVFAPRILLEEGCATVSASTQAREYEIRIQFTEMVADYIREEMASVSTVARVENGASS